MQGLLVHPMHIIVSVQTLETLQKYIVLTICLPRAVFSLVMSLQLILEIRNVQIISLVLNKEMLCLAILKVKPYRTDLGTGCMRSRDYPVVKTSISFFLFLFFSLCVIKLFFFQKCVQWSIFCVISARGQKQKASLQANSKGRHTKLKSVLNPIQTAAGGGLQYLNLYRF